MGMLTTMQKKLAPKPFFTEKKGGKKSPPPSKGGCGCGKK